MSTVFNDPPYCDAPSGSYHRLCDSCGEKVFFDADLRYNTFEPRLADGKCALENLGAWVVLCRGCSQHYTIRLHRRRRSRP